MFMRHIAILILSPLLITIAACSSGPQVRTDADPAVDLSAYRTFAFFEPVATDRAAYGTMLTSRLKESIRRELEQRGCKEVAAKPELRVNFNVNVRDRTDVQSSPAAGGYYGYRAGMYGMWAGYPQDVRTTHYKEGTLAVDLVDAGRQQLVWQGIAEGRINKAFIDNPTAAIDAVVAEIFAKYPVPAGSS